MDYKVVSSFGIDEMVWVVIGFFQKVNDKVFMKLFRFSVICPVEQLDKISLETSISVLFGFTFKKALFSAFLGFNLFIFIYSTLCLFLFSRLNYIFLFVFLSEL
jgi:hypothetical protein